MITKYSVRIANNTDKWPWDTDHNIDILVDESKTIINLKIDSKKWPVAWDKSELLDMSSELLDWILETDQSQILSISSEIVA